MTKGQLILLYVVSITAVIACFFIEPVRQDQGYHVFADRAKLLSIPNFWNVVSNVPFVVIGVMGLHKTLTIKNWPLKLNYIWFFAGIILTGFGSGYYHLQPDNATLVWDRLPMTISFMSFFSIIVGEFINPDAGKRLLHPLLAAGLVSIIVWVLTDDLRCYALIQFLPILLILIVLFFSKKERAYKKYFWLIIVFYTIAKLLESYDSLIYSVFSDAMSGHTLKHFAAAVAPFFFYKYVIRKFNTEN